MRKGTHLSRRRNGQMWEKSGLSEGGGAVRHLSVADDLDDGPKSTDALGAIAVRSPRRFRRQGWRTRDRGRGAGPHASDVVLLPCAATAYVRGARSGVCQICALVNVTSARALRAARASLMGAPCAASHTRGRSCDRAPPAKDGCWPRPEASRGRTRLPHSATREVWAGHAALPR